MINNKITFKSPSFAMNLKNSKFFKRIQMLRRISKEKLRQCKERMDIDGQFESVFCEPSGVLCQRFDDNEGGGGDIGDGEDGHYNFLNANESGESETSEERVKKLQLSLIMKQCQNLEPLSEVKSLSGTGLIHFNNTCFRVKCPTAAIIKKSESNESMPSISSNRGSICLSNTRYLMIGKIAKCLGYKVVKDNKLWNILWTDTLPGVDIYKNMKRFQQVNHFPGMMEICRKDLLSRNLNRMLKLYPKDYRIFPKTWIFPADYGEAINYANSRSKPQTFILKPDAGAQGRGIWLTNDLKRINPTDRMICQTYIGKPLLIDGYKFDLRVYALITSMEPLRIFRYNEGLARFATSKYVEPSPDNNADLYMHLTNYSVNRRNSQYDVCDNDECGSKRKFSAINNWMRRRNYNVDEFWSRIDDIIIKTVLSSWPMLKHNYHACFPSHDKIQACFEILGFDILVDSKLRPYLLEVNHSPSFHTDELVDRQVKRPLIRDTLSLVSTALVDKRQILREDRKRIKQRLLKVRQGDVTQRSVIGGSSINDFTITSTVNRTSECPLSALAQQIAWEESHLGDFRRIMPPNDPTKLNYYCQFYGQQNQASIFADTAASKKREEVAKKLRLELEAKKRKQNEISNRPCAMKFEDRRRKRCAIPRVVVERHRQTQLRTQAHWTPGFISIAEERLRLTYMQMRSDLVKDMKITESIYEGLYNAGSLSHTDKIKFPDIYRSLESGCDIFVTS